MTNEHKACFVIPFIKREKDEWCLKNFLQSAQKYNMTDYLYFIIDDFPTEDYIKSFNQNLKTILFSLSETEIDRYDISCKSNIVSIKKWYGVKKLYDKFDYIAVIDDDVLFLKEFDPYKVFNEIWTNKTCFVKNKCSLNNSIFLRNCAFACGLENNLILKKETEDFYYTCWFNDIPVYKTEGIEEFFNWIDNTKTSTGNTIRENAILNYLCFDYLIYWFWLICYKGLTSKFIDIYAGNSIVEDIVFCQKDINSTEYYLNKIKNPLKNDSVFDKNVLLDCQKRVFKQINKIETLTQTHWSPRKYEETKDIIKNDNIVMQLHVDRTNEKYPYSGIEFRIK